MDKEHKMEKVHKKRKKESNCAGNRTLTKPSVEEMVDLICLCLSAADCAKLMEDLDFDINHAGSKGLTALHLAAECQPDAVTILVQQEGIQLNLQAKDGWTALHLAAQFQPDAVTTLVQQKGIQLNLQNKDGVTALHFAAKYQPDALTTLVQQEGIQLNLQAKYGLTALLIAAKQAHKTPYAQAVQTLLKAPNVDINAFTRNGDRALSLVTKQNPHLLFDLLPLPGSLDPTRRELGRMATEFTTLAEISEILGDAQRSIEGWTAKQVRQAQEAGFQAIYGHFRRQRHLQLQFSQLPPHAQDRLRKVDHDLNALRILYSQLLRTSSFRKLPESSICAEILYQALDQNSAMRASASTLSGVFEYVRSLAELNLSLAELNLSLAEPPSNTRRRV